MKFFLQKVSHPCHVLGIIWSKDVASLSCCRHLFHLLIKLKVIVWIMWSNLTTKETCTMYTTEIKHQPDMICRREKYFVRWWKIYGIHFFIITFDFSHGRFLHIVLFFKPLFLVIIQLTTLRKSCFIILVTLVIFGQAHLWRLIV